ncbi:MAG TPA: L,D-transpeptidase [Patescibacteria group bacterium]|nr:L,D-transpeptidase [Patescibacteria group bacterium]
MKLYCVVFLMLLILNNAPAFAAENDTEKAVPGTILFTPVPATDATGTPILDGIIEPPKKAEKALPPEVATATPGGMLLDGIRIDISIKEQRLRVIENYRIIHEFKTSTGRYKGSTPKGVSRVYNHAPNPISRMYKCHLYRWLAVTPDGKVGIHGLFMSGYERLLGRPASHGCIRLSRPNAEVVYNWVVALLKSGKSYPQVYIY